MLQATRILLLEDELILRDLLAQALTGEGYLVFAVGTVDEGEFLLKLLGWEAFDIVVSDVHLNRDPRAQKGYQFHRYWKERYPTPPFVFLNGSASEEEPADESCRVYHLPKPFLFPHLRDLLKSVLCLA